jgi:hypothetical protein
MTSGFDPHSLAHQARRRYVEEVVRGLVPLVQTCIEAAKDLLEKPAEHSLALRRRDLVHDLTRNAQSWHRGMVHGLRAALTPTTGRGGDPDRAGATARGQPAGLSLVDDDTIELEIVTSRLSLAIMDRASWEFSDLRARVAHLERREELDSNDLLRAHVLARIAFDAWRDAHITITSWRELQPVLHDEFALLVEEAYHEANRWLIEQAVLPDVDLRPAIRRSRGVVTPPSQWSPATGFAHSGGGSLHDMSAGLGADVDSSYMRQMGSAVGEETRLMTRASPLVRNREQAEAVLGRLNRLVSHHLPGFQPGVARAGGGKGVSAPLDEAIHSMQAGLRERLSPSTRAGADAMVTTPVLLDELHQRKQALKNAAATPEERATIEIVALLFQSILTEERIPASVRVWFARLQMPVLRVAVGEPDFFATTDHPARRLIDRMGSCVMGFDGGAPAVSESLEREIKRIVQVVEAYPDTGRRVFQTVLTEFESFLENYFRHENEATKKGVSLAQQVEQRETLAIQYTIELRRMLNEVPVQEGVRQFLFQVWADVLAVTAVRTAAHSEETKAMKRAAADLIWSASAKVTRDERGEVIRRLPPLLNALREGMQSAGMDQASQDEHIQQLNNSLAAAFTAKAAAIPDDRLAELMQRLETLEELLPESEVQIDESLVLDLSGHENAELEVVHEGGSMPSPAMLAWARELQVGSWFMLDYRGRNEAVQLAWQGLRKQLSLFVTPQGRCVLFQQHRLASFLQAGLLLPAQDEALTVRATRSALAKLDVDASRLLN